MRIWLLEPHHRVQLARDGFGGGAFWEHAGWDTCQRAIVRAGNENQAREIAQQAAQAEAYDYPTGWLDPELSICLPVVVSGEPELLAQECNWG